MQRIARLRLFALVGMFAWPASSESVIADELRVATFNVDATPELGTPVAYAPAREILDPLSARGVVLLGAKRPIVLCAVDWIGIGNRGHDVWREELAKAAGTTRDRVAVHCLHQHDGARCDFDAEALLAGAGQGGKHFDVVFARKTIARAAAAIRKATEDSQPVTHLGIGKARIEKVASNRRILGPDGKVKIIRWSKMTDPAAIAAPAGVIDPFLQAVSFWNGDKPIVCLTYYATHPQSYYGQGDVTSEFVGIARAMREKDVPGVAMIHFNGASGNVAAGKYNDGSKKMRPILAQRMADGMKHAWEATKRIPITARDVEWRVVPVSLPVAKHIDVDKLRATLADEEAKPISRVNAAVKIAFATRMAGGHKIDVTCLRLGDTYVLHLPGELFVEYQLAAQKLRPDNAVLMAAYGDYGMGYIGTEIAYSQGGYETSERASNVAPSAERVLMPAIKKLME